MRIEYTWFRTATKKTSSDVVKSVTTQLSRLSLRVILLLRQCYSPLFQSVVDLEQIYLHDFYNLNLCKI